MKKILGLAVAVAVALAFTAYAEDVVKTKTKEVVKTPAGTETITTKTVATPTETKTVIKEKEKGVKDKITVVETAKETDVTAVEKLKKGPLVKETVKFSKIDANGDYIYVIKDTKLLRLKHKLPDSMKQDMLKKKEGEQITITSTYPLTNQELAVILEAR